MADRDDKKPGRPEARPIGGGPRPMPPSLATKKARQGKKPSPPPPAEPRPAEDKA